MVTKRMLAQEAAIFLTSGKRVLSLVKVGWVQGGKLKEILALSVGTAHS